MDVVTFTDVSVLTVLIMFVVVGGAFMIAGAAIRCAVERGVKSGLRQSKLNYDAILEHGIALTEQKDKIKKLADQLCSQDAALARIEKSLGFKPKRRKR